MPKIIINNKNQYLINGRVYDRVTQVIDSTIRRRELEEWRKRVGEEEAERIKRETSIWGEMVHNITMHSDMKNDYEVEGMLNSLPELLPSLIVWNEWVKEMIVKWILIEKVVWSERQSIACRIDRVGIIRGDKPPSIIDLKTGGLYDSIGIQIYGAYLGIYNEKTKKKAKRAIAVQLPREEPGILRIKDYTKEKYIAQWEECKKDYWNLMGRRNK